MVHSLGNLDFYELHPKSLLVGGCISRLLMGKEKFLTEILAIDDVG